MNQQDATGTGPYNLEELVQLTGVSDHTIRSWIKAQVMRTPNGKGRGAHYDKKHVIEVKFLNKVQEAFAGRLPLGTFADLFEGVDQATIERIANGHEGVTVVGKAARAARAPRAMRSVVEDAPDSDPVPKNPPPPVSHRRGDDWEEGPWTTVKVADDVSLCMRSDDPERAAWLARMARKLREWSEDGG